MEEHKIPAAVVDASFMAAYFLGLFTGKETSHEQGFSKARDAISAIVSQNGQLFVPNIFFYEMGNILHTAAHKRITKTEQHEIEYDLFELPIVFDENCDTALMMRIQEFADAYSLSFYDAAYLELSGRLQLPLLTFDSVLENAVHIESAQKHTSRKT